MRERIGNYVVRHFQAAVNSLGQLSRMPLASFMTCLVIGISLALPTALFVALKNLDTVAGRLHKTMQITLYLKADSKEADANQLLTTLQQLPQIQSAKIVSPTEGLQEIQQQAGFEGAFENLPNNPLPWVILIEPKSVQALGELTQTLREMPHVETLQLDKLWVERLNTLMTFAQRATYALAAFLGLAVLIIVNNAIRSATQQNQREIEVIKLIGGTSGFIRRPFLYAGIIYGLLGGIIAWQLVDILLLLLNPSLQHLGELYNSQFQLMGIGLKNTLMLLFFSMLLGLLGSWFAVTRYLKSSF